jgi:hypothetical protein
VQGARTHVAGRSWIPVIRDEMFRLRDEEQQNVQHTQKVCWLYVLPQRSERDGANLPGGKLEAGETVVCNKSGW